MKKYNLDEQDFGTICVCALRYAMGRETYMPGLVRDFVRPLLPELPDKTIGVMVNDCVDKPGWLKWEQEVKAEQERRKEATDGQS